MKAVMKIISKFCAIVTFIILNAYEKLFIYYIKSSSLLVTFCPLSVSFYLLVARSHKM